MIDKMKIEKSQTSREGLNDKRIDLSVITNKSSACTQRSSASTYIKKPQSHSSSFFKKRSKGMYNSFEEKQI